MVEPAVGRACPVCGNDAPGSVCRYCGTPQTSATTLDEERALLKDIHDAMSAALANAKGDDAQLVRDRFLRNAPVPASEELLIDEALRCQQWFSDSANMEAPAQRFEACLVRLELQAIDRPELGKKVELLRKQLTVAQARSRNFGIWVVLFLLLALASIAAGITVAVMAVRR